MIGSTIEHNNSIFVTHTTLPKEKSALVTTTRSQKFWIIALFCLGLVLLFLYPHSVLVAIIAVLSFVYFADMLFSLYIINKSMNVRPEVRFSRKELSAIKDRTLPLYTILCPLYKEASVLEQFIYAVQRLDWPKDRLEVFLLLEEDDVETQEAAAALQLPWYVQAIIVPDSQPKTKPKACNYGLGFAHGEYLVVYDAEDIPESNQLKKAYRAFQKLPKEIVCVQAKLNFFNPEQNLITRLFTAEYSLWFDLILPGLQSIKAYIPLGGTSNHFRLKDLLKLQGWDPFNVTEDCDLGARIFHSGYQTAIIDSTTYEEANSRLSNWLRQRSRWIKGYMQTYLVHMRKPLEFAKNFGVGALIFQLILGFRVTFLIINPLLWLLTIAYFVLHSTLGSQIESLYPPAVYYVAVSTLVIGNFLYLYYYMIGCARRGQWHLIKYIYTVPVYWLLGSVAASIAFYQLLVKPHYWEKTNHGFAVNLKGLPKFSSEGNL